MFFLKYVVNSGSLEKLFNLSIIRNKNSFLNNNFNRWAQVLVVVLVSY